MPSLELKVPPLVVWLVFAGAMFGVASVAPGLSYPLPARLALALTLVGLGGAVALAGVVAFRRQRTTVNPLTPSASSAVVSNGVYRVSRNPMYLGFLLALAGWALYLAHAGAALLVPAFGAYLTRYQIEPEERALRAKFGPEFAHYQARVRRDVYKRQGDLWSEGLGGEGQAAEGVRWWRQAARLNDAEGQWRFGRALAQGEGVEKNPLEACVWLAAASAQGNQEATKLLRELQAGLSEPQRQELKVRLTQPAAR